MGRACHCIGEMDVDYVAGLGEGVAGADAGPLPVFGEEDDGVGCDAGWAFAGRESQTVAELDDKRVNVFARFGLNGPVGMAVQVRFEEIWIESRTFSRLSIPAMTALVGGETVGDLRGWPAC